MAERRMFSKTVINKQKFLVLPPTARLLYYDLGMAADDDGAVEAFMVMRATGACEEDLQSLVRNGFIELLNDDYVAYIVHWKTNNHIRRDRYRESVYADLIEENGHSLGIEQQKEQKCEETQENENKNDVETNGQPMVNQRSTQYRLGKVSIGKFSHRERAPHSPHSEKAKRAASWVESEFTTRTPESKPFSDEEREEWEECFDKLLNEGYKYRTLSDVVVWATEDKFWRTRIVNGKALYRNFRNILTAMNDRGEN